VTVEADPIARGVETLVVPPPGLVELTGETRELELHLVDGAANLDQPAG